MQVVTVNSSVLSSALQPILCRKSKLLLVMEAKGGRLVAADAKQGVGQGASCLFYNTIGALLIESSLKIKVKPVILPLFLFQERGK